MARTIRFVFVLCAIGAAVFSSPASAATVTALAPTAGEVLKVGTLYTIKWRNDTTPATNYVVLQLYRGTEYYLTISSSASNIGTYSWTVPTTLDTTVSYRIKVMFDVNPNAFGYSGTFTVKDSAGITVTSPVTGDSLGAGNSVYIQWQSAGNTGSYYGLSLYSGGQLITTITSSYYSYSVANSYYWTVPSGLDTTKTYSVKVASSSRPTVAGNSGTFKIYDRWNVKVTTPARNDSLTIGSYYYIYWQSSGLGSYVKIDLFRQGLLVTTISSMASNTGTYGSWYIPTSLVPGTGYSVKVSSYTVLSRYAFSDTFVVVPVPKITVTGPLAGARLAYGDSSVITWRTEGKTGSKVSIDLYKAGYSTLTLAASRINDSLFSWIVPSTLTEGTDYKVRVSTSAVYGESGLFYIGPKASRVVFTPDSTAKYRSGDTVQIAWRSAWFSTSTYDYVDIALYRGTALVTSIASSAYNYGSKSWVIPVGLTNSSQYRILISLTSNPAVSAYSQYFSITNTPLLALVNPANGAVIEQGASAVISWSGKGQVGTVRFSYQIVPQPTAQIFDSSTLQSGSLLWKTPVVSVNSTCFVYAACAADPTVLDTAKITLGVRPVLISPPTSANKRPVLMWHPVAPNEVYLLQIDTSRYFNAPLLSTPVQDTSFTPGLDLAGGIYYWTVTPSTQLKSSVGTFTVLNPGVPVPIAVVPNPTTNHRPALTWFKVAGASSYTLLAATNSSFVNPLLSFPLTDTAYLPITDFPTGTIYWKVRSDLINQYCAAQTISIVSDSLPILKRFNGALVTTARPAFTWYSVNHATNYRIEIIKITDSAGNRIWNPVIALSTADTSFVPLAPLASGLYYWRISSNLNASLFSDMDSLNIQASNQVRERMHVPGFAYVKVGQSKGGIILYFGQTIPGETDIAFYTPDGKQIVHTRTMHSPGTYSWTPSVTLPAGMYVLVVSVDGKRFTQRVNLVR